MLLLVPESFDAAHLPSVNVERLPAKQLSSSPVIWPTVEVLRTVARSYDRVAITACASSETVSALLSACGKTNGRDRAQIVCTDSPLVSGVVGDMTLDLQSLVMRLLPSDLLVISSAQLLEVPTELCIADAVISTLPGFNSIGRPVEIERLPAAGPGTSSGDAAMLRVAVRESLASSKITEMDCSCIEAGILLLWDHLEESHRISQSLEGRGSSKTADYWHGIMHRREPDAGNAAYWFRRVGAHPAFQLLSSGLLTWLRALGAREAHCELAKKELLTDRGFNPFAMIELAQSAMKSPQSLEDQTARMVQYLEMINLLNWSCRVH